jgi:hypothetical protein
VKTQTEFQIIADQLSDIYRNLKIAIDPVEFIAILNPEWHEKYASHHSKWMLKPIENSLYNSYLAAGTPCEGTLSWSKEDPPVIRCWTTLTGLSNLIHRLRDYARMESEVK